MTLLAIIQSTQYLHLWVRHGLRQEEKKRQNISIRTYLEWSLKLSILANQSRSCVLNPQPTITQWYQNIKNCSKSFLKIKCRHKSFLAGLEVLIMVKLLFRSPEFKSGSSRFSSPERQTQLKSLFFKRQSAPQTFVKNVVVLEIDHGPFRQSSFLFKLIVSTLVPVLRNVMRNVLRNK